MAIDHNIRQKTSCFYLMFCLPRIRVRLFYLTTFYPRNTHLSWPHALSSSFESLRISNNVLKNFHLELDATEYSGHKIKVKSWQ